MKVLKEFTIPLSAASLAIIREALVDVNEQYYVFAQTHHLGGTLKFSVVDADYGLAMAEVIDKCRHQKAK